MVRSRFLPGSFRHIRIRLKRAHFDIADALKNSAPYHHVNAFKILNQSFDQQIMDLNICKDASSNASCLVPHLVLKQTQSLDFLTKINSPYQVSIPDSCMA